jgi:hypothetical protein
MNTGRDTGIHYMQELVLLAVHDKDGDTIVENGYTDTWTNMCEHRKYRKQTGP